AEHRDVGAARLQLGDVALRQAAPRRELPERDPELAAELADPPPDLLEQPLHRSALYCRSPGSYQNYPACPVSRPCDRVAEWNGSLSRPIPPATSIGSSR